MELREGHIHLQTCMDGIGVGDHRGGLGVQGAPKEGGKEIPMSPKKWGESAAPCRRLIVVLGETLAQVFQRTVDSPSLEVFPARLGRA